MIGKQSAKMTFESSKGRVGYRIRFYDRDLKRRSLWLGNLEAGLAETWRKHIEHLAQCLQTDSPFCGATTAWLRSLPKNGRTKLAGAGLIAPDAKSTLAENQVPKLLKSFIDWYISRRNVKAATKAKWEQTRDALVRYFGEQQEIQTIAASDAEAWREWLAASGNVKEGREKIGPDGKPLKRRTQLADNTVRRRTGIARQFFRYAIKAKLIEENPFSGLAASVHGNESRQFFISHELFQKVIAKSDDPEFRAILALSRLGGLRCPSEVMRLKWEDIDLENGRMRIHACKTEHHKDGGIRYCPLFIELKPFLIALYESIEVEKKKQTNYVILENRGSEAYLRTKMYRLLKKSGITPWPKLFHNMRASRETELLDSFPVKDVCSWIGNSQAIAMKHYAMRREDSFSRAAGIGLAEPKLAHAEIGGPAGGPKNGILGQEEATTGEAEICDSGSQILTEQQLASLRQFLAEVVKMKLMGEEGLEPPTSTL